MRLRHMLLACFVIAMCTFVARDAQAISISGMSANTTSVSKYDIYELNFDLTNVNPSNYNPFRPDTTSDSLSNAGVDVYAMITTPSGSTVKVWGFWDVDYDYLGQCQSYGQNFDRFDKFVPASAPHWRIRYAPKAVGTYTGVIYAKDSSGTATSSQFSFTCGDSSNKGFVKVSTDGQRLVYSNGDPYIPMGTGFWDGTSALNDIPEMQSNGINFVRRWLVNASFGDVHRENYPQIWDLGSGSYDTGTYRTGKSSIKKDIGGTGTVMEQPFIGIRPSAYYKASAWIHTSSSFNGTAAVYVTVQYTDGSTKTFTGNTVGGNAGWTQSSVSFSTSSTADFMSFKVNVLSGNTGTVWVDDCELYEMTSGGSVKVAYNYIQNPSCEIWNPSQLRLWPLWRLDYLLNVAQQKGLLVQPCIFDYTLWSPSGPTGFYAKFFPDFFSDSGATAQEDRALRNLVARYAAYRSLFAWELTNEMDPAYTDVRYNWIANRANTIRNNDPENHLVTNSFWSYPTDPRMVQMPGIDINQAHYYLHTEEFNGGQGVPTWNVIGTGGTLDRNPGNAHGGTSSIKLTANGSNIEIPGIVYIKPNSSYTISFWVKPSSVSADTGIIIRYYGIDGTEVAGSTSLSVSGTSGYVNKTYKFTSPSTACRLVVSPRISGSSGTAWVDDIQLIDNTTGKNIFYNGDFESLNLGDDEFEWAHANTFITRQEGESGPNGSKKPWMSGEFGLMGYNTDLSGWANPKSSNPRHDTTGIHLHNAMWAQFMASSGGHLPTYWWVGDYVQPYNLMGQWKPITTFALNLPFYQRGSMIATAPYFGDVQAQTSNPTVRAIGSKLNDSAYIWINNKGYTWSKVVRDYVQPTAATADITIPGFTDDAYTIDWYNTQTGAVTSETKTTSGGVLTLSVSSLTQDTAAIIKPAAKPVVTVTIAVDKLKASSGDTITYTVSYTNSGASEATAVAMSLPIPSNTTYVSSSSGGTYSGVTNTVSWTIASVPAGSSGKVTASVRIN